MRALWIVVAVVCTIIPLAGQLYGDRAGGWLMVDFRAYYCASSALVRRENPYTVASLHSCETRESPPFYRATPAVTVPAPYPPYALALVAPLAVLPFAAAATVWWFVLGGCVILAAWALGRVSRQPFLIPWACLVLSLGLTALPGGNLLPAGVVALIVAALCVRNGRPVAAAIALAIAMVEPHVALPAAVAFFVRYREGRVPLAIVFLILAAVSLLFGGVANNVSYLTGVIPAHALSEVSRDNQYSLSTVVAALGATDQQAVLLGSVSYVLALMLGTFVALRLARTQADAPLVVLLPPAIALLGGSFVHTVEIAAAVPAALLLSVRTQPRAWQMVAALVLLAVPWMMATSVASFLAPLFPVAFLVFALGGNRSTALACAVVSLAIVVSLFELASHPAPTPSHYAAHPYIDPALAEASWRAFVLNDSTNRLVTWLLRLPTWIGLIVLTINAVLLSRATRMPRVLPR